MFREFWVRVLLQLVEISSIENLTPQDVKFKNLWLSSSHQDKGFHTFLKARDRQISEFIVSRSKTIATEADRLDMAEYVGRRLELIRLKNRAEAQFKRGS